MDLNLEHRRCSEGDSSGKVTLPRSNCPSGNPRALKMREGVDCDTKIIQLGSQMGPNLHSAAKLPNEMETSPPKYIYMPLDIPCDPASINEWIQKTKTEMKPKYTLYTTHYWYLDEFSCILVKRNRLWFQSVLPKIQNTWNLIEISRTNTNNSV